MKEKIVVLTCVILPLLMFSALPIAGQCPTATPQPPEIAGSLRDGATEITGNGAAPGPGCTATIQVYDVSAGNDKKQLLAPASGAAPAADGSFTMRLAEPLREDQVIAVAETFAGANGSVTQLSAAANVIVPADWGRVKGYFTSGILVSQNQDSFSQSSLFLAFTLDKTWRMPGYFHTSKYSPGINTFFETRLTSIPVTSCAPASSATAGTSNEASACAPAPSTTSTPTNLETFLSSRKVARLDVGIYFPVTLSDWTYNKKPNSLFIAPLAKVGFDTPTGSLNQIQPASSTSAPVVVAGSGNVTAVNPTSFYNFYGFGGRIGHYANTCPREKKDKCQRDRAPELVSYLDVLVGPFSNLETLVQPDGSAPGVNVGRKRLYRLSLEGVLKIPTTPLIIGFSANVGQEALGTGGINIVQRAGDDLRFLFGARFDVAKLLAHVTRSAP